MKMKLVLERFPIDLLDLMESELARHTKCEITQTGTDVTIHCDADVIKCMEVLAVADKFIKNN